MNPTPDQLWKRLVHEASPPPMREADDAEVSHIVSLLKWQPGRSAAATWEEILLPLLLRFALPSAAIILILAATLPEPDQTTPSDTVDDLIASIIPQP
jgi:hypothetical protein